MTYFKDNESYNVEESNIEQLLRELSDICLEELMLSSDAYVCMIKMNMHGYKRLHRHISKKFQDFYLELQCESLEKFNRVLSSEINFKVYKINNLKEHLETWNLKLKEHLKKVGYIIKQIFEQEGYIPCTAQKIQNILYKNIIKNERAMKKFEDCDYSYHIIYEHDKYLHEKMKEKEY